MLRPARLVTAMALALALSGTAHAASVLTTATLGVANGGRLLCFLTSFDKKPATVTLQIIDPLTGATLGTFDCGGSVGPGAGCFVATPTPNFKNGYCKVTSSSRKVKAVLWVQDAAGNTLASEPATK